MPTAIALHTIHRPGKTKGSQVLVAPGKGKASEFQCTEEELAKLEALGAAKRVESKDADTGKGKTGKSSGKTAAKTETTEPAQAGGDDLGV